MQTVTIPTQDVIMAMDIASAYLMKGMHESISLNDNPLYLRLSTMYSLYSIKSQFADKILNSVLQEGKRRVMSKQPIHARFMSTLNSDVNLTSEIASKSNDL